MTRYSISLAVAGTEAIYWAMDLSLQKLTQALSLRQQISALEEKLSTLFGGSPSSSTGDGRRKGGRRSRRAMSPATRAKLAAAARARWARRKGTTATAPAAAAGPRRRKGLTAAGRRKLSEAMKARWAARRKAGGSAPTAPKTAGKKRGLTAAGRRRLSESMKARWAARRKAAGKK